MLSLKVWKKEQKLDYRSRKEARLRGVKEEVSSALFPLRTRSLDLWGNSEKSGSDTWST